MALGVLAGAFLSIGALLSLLVMTGNGLGLGPGSGLGGLAVSLGLLLVAISGAELLTGNNRISMAGVGRKVTTKARMRDGLLVHADGFMGAVAAVVIVMPAGTLTLGDGRFAATAFAMAEAEAEAEAARLWRAAFFRCVPFDGLVCLAVWLSVAARYMAGKILAIVMSISILVALGFENLVADMFSPPLPLMVGVAGIVSAAWWAMSRRSRSATSPAASCWSG